MFGAFFPSRLFKKEKKKNTTIQSSQMYRHSSWKIVFLHSLSSSFVSLRGHMENLGKDSKIFSHQDLCSRKVCEEVPAPLYTVFYDSSIIQTQTIFFTVVLYPWMILWVMHAGMDIILWTPANWSRTIKKDHQRWSRCPWQSALPCDAKFKGWRSWANEGCCSADSQPKQQQR